MCFLPYFRKLTQKEEKEKDTTPLMTFSVDEIMQADTLNSKGELESLDSQRDK